MTFSLTETAGSSFHTKTFYHENCSVSIECCIKDQMKPVNGPPGPPQHLLNLLIMVNCRDITHQYITHQTSSTNHHTYSIISIKLILIIQYKSLTCFGLLLVIYTNKHGKRFNNQKLESRRFLCFSTDSVGHNPGLWVRKCFF